MMEKMDKNELVLFQLRELEENSKCADCTDSFPRYMNTTHGTFVCSVCGAIHRELGNRVKSIASDKFTEQDIEKLKNVGNKLATELWLNKWNQKEYPLPHPNEEKKVREFIKLKYQDKKWLKNGIKEEDIVTIYSGNTPNRSTPKTQSTITSPIQNRGETKVHTDSKSSLSKEFESLNLGVDEINNPSSSSTTASYASSTNTTTTTTTTTSNNSSNSGSSKPFNPFREENAYFTTNNSVKSPSEKPQFPPFSDKPFDQHSYLNNKDIHSGYDKKIKIQTPPQRPPPTSVYDKKPDDNNNSALQLEYHQQEQLQQFNNNNNNMMNNQMNQQQQQQQQQQNYGNPFDMNNSMNGMNNTNMMNNSMNGMNYNQQQQFNNNNNMMNNSMNGMNYNQPQQQQFNNNNNNQQLVIQQNPFNNMDQVQQYHQQLHQQNMMQQQQPQQQNQPTTTTTTITTIPINPDGSVAQGYNPYMQQQQQQREVPLDELFGKKIESDPIFPAYGGGSFESGNNIDSADEEQKRAWREIEHKKQQFLKDRELAKALQREEEEIAKSRPRANTEPTRRGNNNNNNMNNYSSYRSSNRPSSSSRGRSRSSDYDDPFETAPEAYNMNAYNNSRHNNSSNRNFDDYDNYMRKNPRIAESAQYDPNRNYGYKTPFEYQSPQTQQPHHNQHQRSYSNDEYQIQPYNNTQEIALYKQLSDCEHCGKRVELEGMSYHKNTECILRQCRCKYCNKLVKQLTMADHEVACQNKTYTCGVCGKMILGREMPNHMTFVHNS